MTSVILAVTGLLVLLIIVLAFLWTQIEADYGCQVEDCNQGRGCRGQCLRQPCPEPWLCGRGKK